MTEIRPLTPPIPRWRAAMTRSSAWTRLQGQPAGPAERACQPDRGCAHRDPACGHLELSAADPLSGARRRRDHAGDQRDRHRQSGGRPQGHQHVPDHAVVLWPCRSCVQPVGAGGGAGRLQDRPGRAGCADPDAVFVPVRVDSLRSGLSGWQYYDIALEVIDVAGARLRVMHVDYVYSSTCPCSLELSEHARQTRGRLATPHSQRSVARISLVMDGPERIWFEDVIALCRAACRPRHRSWSSARTSRPLPS